MSKIQKIFNNDTVLGCLGCVVIILLCMPYLVLGEDSYITIHDNLDGIISNLKLLKDNHALFDPDAVLPIMDGIGRSSFGNEWNLTLIPFAILPCYWANVVNVIIVKLTAFIGLFLLMRRHIVEKLYPTIAMLIALAFACIPFNYATCCGISAAGVPLLAYAFLNLRDKRKPWLSYLLITYYALGSFLAFSGLFVCLYIFVYGVYLYMQEHQVNANYLIGFILLCCIYALTNISLFTSFFLDSEYISHRSEFMRGELLSLDGVFKDWRLGILHGQYHAGVFPAVYALVIYAISIIVKRTKIMWTIGGIWLSILVFVLIAKCLPFIFPSIHIFQEFQFDRFYFLYPAVCFAMLAIAIDNINCVVASHSRMFNSAMAILCVFMSIQMLRTDDEIKKNWKHLYKANYVQEPTYRHFYAEDLFNAIADDMQMENRANVKVASVAMFPAIAEYNGFYCIDGYLSDYPLAYKKNIRSIIKSELDKNESIRRYFDLWGSRCYLYSAEEQGEFLHNKNDGFAIADLDFDISALSNIGCEYIYSAVPLPSLPNVEFCKSYDTSDSFWRIFVYRVQ